MLAMETLQWLMASIRTGDLELVQYHKQAAARAAAFAAHVPSDSSPRQAVYRA